MIIKLVAFIASLILVFLPAAELPAKSDVLIETSGNIDENRYADEINGANGTRFFIQRPKAENLKEINASYFGFSEDNYDNFSAFQAALNYCAENQYTKLVIDNGIYYFRNPQTLCLTNCKDLFVEGNGATFVFSDKEYRISIRSSDCVEFSDINFDWNWQEKPLASVVTIKNASPENNTIDLQFRNEKYCHENIVMSAITQCDPETLTFGAISSSKEIYLYQDINAIKSVKKIAPDTLRVEHNSCMDHFENGEMYILRHFVYGGSIFHLTDYSKNLTFDTVNIYGGHGMAYVCDGNSSHFNIINNFIGIREEDKDERSVSLTADAIHIVNSDGCFNIENCDFSAMGDDAVNVHDGLGYVSSVNGRTLNLIASAMRLYPGDTLGFKNEKFETTDFTAKIVSVKNLEGITKEVILDCDLPAELVAGYTAFSKECNSANYVIRNNYFHDNRARGLLLQSSNGLCENNKFYKIMGQAIKVVMDIEPTLWQEGTGVDNLIIRNNTFERCNDSGWGSVIDIGSNIAGKKAETTVFSNIEITSNTFYDFSSYILRTNNVNGLIFTNNTIDPGNTFEPDSHQGKAYFDKHCLNVTFAENEWTDEGANGTRKIAESQNVSVWAHINSQIK